MRKVTRTNADFSSEGGLCVAQTFPAFTQGSAQLTEEGCVVVSGVWRGCHGDLGRAWYSIRPTARHLCRRGSEDQFAMADTKQVEAPTNAPDFPESSMNQFDDDGHYIDGPGYPSRELSAEEVVARKLYEERQRAAAEGRESLTEQEQVHRRLHPIERFSVASNVSMELIVNHNTKEATLRLTGGGNRSGRRSELGGLTINLPAGSWSFEPESRVKL